MAYQSSISGISKTLCIIGSVLLIVMAVFHGSGYSYVADAIGESDAEGFLKQIVPVLFAHPSIHLIGLAAFGILAVFLGEAAGKVLVLLAALIMVDGALAFYLGGILPGILLLAAALSFIVASVKIR